jgi:hypothetical protein
VLAVSSPQRIAQLPKVPTFAELGMKELTSQEWIGLLAPKGTKPEVAARLHDAANRAFAQPAVQKALAEMAFGVTTSTQAEFAQLLKGDLDKWGPVVRSTGFGRRGPRRAAAERLHRQKIRYDLHEICNMVIIRSVVCANNADLTPARRAPDEKNTSDSCRDVLP